MTKLGRMNAQPPAHAPQKPPRMYEIQMPTRHRVGVWRKLQRMGAVRLRGAGWILPETPETTELFQWLVQEIQSFRGEATLLRVDRVETMTDDEIAALFHKVRNPEYQAVVQGCREILAQLDRYRTSHRGSVAAPRAKLDSLKRELDRIPHIDRIASAWLIKRFCDPDAKFGFADAADAARKGIPFDVLGADFGHHGEDCTFETLVKRFGIKDRRVTSIAEIVHEADLHDGKFTRNEATGLDLAINGLVEATPDDDELLARGMGIFEGLYAVLKQKT